MNSNRIAWGFKHTFSSPTHSQSNGMAEKGVGICKALFKKAKMANKDPYLALLDNINVPRDTVLGSPVQRMFHRRTKTRLPTAESLLKPKIIQPDVVKRQLQFHRDKQKIYYDKSAKDLPPLKVGDLARLKTDQGWKPAIVTAVGPDPRSYKVVTNDNRIFRRNRKHLLKTGETELERSKKVQDTQVHRPKLQSRATGLSAPPIAGKPSTPVKVVPMQVPLQQTTLPSLQNTTTLPKSLPPLPKTQVRSTPPCPNIQTKSITTRSGRAIKPPVKFKDFLVN